MSHLFTALLPRPRCPLSTLITQGPPPPALMAGSTHSLAHSLSSNYSSPEPGLLGKEAEAPPPPVSPGTLHAPLCSQPAVLLAAPLQASADASTPGSLCLEGITYGWMNHPVQRSDTSMPGSREANFSSSQQGGRTATYINIFPRKRKQNSQV